MRCWMTGGLAAAWGSSALAREGGEAAPCCGGKMAMVFMDAALEMKLVMAILWIAVLAALVAWGLARRRGTMGPGWLHGLQAWGPCSGSPGPPMCSPTAWWRWPS